MIDPTHRPRHIALKVERVTGAPRWQHVTPDHMPMALAELFANPAVLAVTVERR